MHPVEAQLSVNTRRLGVYSVPDGGAHPIGCIGVPDRSRGIINGKPVCEQRHQLLGSN